MLADVVIDTNVLIHAQNPAERRSADSRRFLTTLLHATALLCVDEGFACDPRQNRSHIGHEYLGHLRAGSLALDVIVKLATGGRIRQLARRAPQPTAREINQLLRNSMDRIFLSVAFNSDERVLVSHDYQDFQPGKRETIRKTLGVNVLEAQDCEPQLL